MYNFYEIYLFVDSVKITFILIQSTINIYEVLINTKFKK